jgi:single-strand DNA-binding protein
MAGVNKAIIVGNLGADPEVRTLESGAKVATIRVATTERYKDRDGNQQENTEWHNIVLWRGLADITERYLKKGRQVYIEGKLKTRKWTDQNGNDRYTTEIVAQEMTLLGGSPGQQDGQQSAPSSTGATNVVSEPSQPSINDIDDDLPF